MKFAARMAWRDFRARPSRFLLYAAAIAVGVGSLAAIESFRLQLDEAIQGQGKNLLGADLVLRSIRPFNEEQRNLVNNWPGPRSKLISYRTLLLHPESGQTRLVEVEAVEGNFPLYGGISTEPPSAAVNFHGAGELLLDHILMLQMGLSRGSLVNLGGQSFPVAGAILQTPGEVPARSLMAPKVTAPLAAVDEARLRSPGTMARFEWSLSATNDSQLSRLPQLSMEARALGLEVETVAGRRQQLLGGTDRIGRYLGLMGFTSLVIGCLGVAGAVHFFISSKIQVIAQLRCIGAGIFKAATIFILQLVCLALIGASLGVWIGAVAASHLPSLLAMFLPVPIHGVLRIDAALSAWLVGVVFTLLAGIYPITRIRKISPLISLRVELAARRSSMDLPGLTCITLIVLSLFIYSWHQLGTVKMAGAYLGGLIAVIAVLAITGHAIRWGCRKAVRPGWPYVVRMAASGLYRPQNQTGLLVVSLGLGIFLLNTVDMLEQHLLKDVDKTRQDRPNLALIDIQVDQRDALLELFNSFNPEKLYVEPMITMRLKEINAIPIDRVDQVTGQSRPNWALRREYRTTYRSEIKHDIERIIDGVWFDQERWTSEFAPVSLEKGIAEALRVGVGDHLQFDIHGELFDVEIANVREVEWKSMQPNFFVIFPVGIIDDAPQSILMFGQLEDVNHRAEFQREIAINFPNVTAIDVSLMMNTVSRMMEQLSAAIKTIAWFTLFAGFMVLFAILKAGRHQRLREGVLLRTIGAPGRFISQYQALELLLLSFGAAISGLLLSTAGSAVIVKYGLNMPFQPDFSSSWVYPVALGLLTGLVGWYTALSSTKLNPANAWRRISI